jgi:GH43 family beta-xylosidase
MCHEGVFFALNTDGQRVFLRRSVHVLDLFRQPAAAVWKAPRRGANSRHLWAPELHWLDGRWFIYYAADGGRNRNHRLWALEALGDDPAGPYRCRGMIQTGGWWAIDATVFRDPGGNLFLLWSGWEGPEKGAQNLYIAPMSDPVTLGGPRVLLTEPTEPWEQRGGAAICEGPAVLRRGEVTCIVYSASASWTVHSCLGMLVNRDGDYLNPASWIKTGPVFQRTAAVWGVGHCSLIDREEGGLIFYHAKTKRTRGWRDRNIRAQPFAWNATGLPCFGVPAALPPRPLPWGPNQG